MGVATFECLKAAGTVAEQVEPGMTLAIGNCGIYRERFGVRMEDTVWMTERGPVALTRFEKIVTV